MYRLLAALLATGVTGSGIASAAGDRAQSLVVPDGFTIRIVTDAVPGARQMALGPDGTLFVGTMAQGRVYALPDALAGAPPDVITLASGLTMPSGVAVRGRDLYVAATSEVLHFADLPSRPGADAPYRIVTDDLPRERHHGWKYLGFGPDAMLYVPVGAPCNVCLSDDPRFASILRMDPATGATSLYARGVRNSVGFDWHPVDGRMWFTDNGRDLMGDDVPPDEVNVVTGQGQHFGFPFVHGEDIADPRFGASGPDETTPPRLVIQAHSAALGIAFYTADAFPARYRNALFVAEHGSWNRSSKVGYRVSVFTFDGDEPHHAPFVTGWLANETAWGRPNDVLVTEAGTLLISDDAAGAIYEVRHAPDADGSAPSGGPAPTGVPGSR